MPVAKTASPTVSPIAPYASPWNARPSSSTRTALIEHLRTAHARRSRRLPVDDGWVAPEEGRDDPGRQLPAGERGVPAPASQGRWIDGPAGGRVDQRQVGDQAVGEASGAGSTAWVAGQLRFPCPRSAGARCTRWLQLP